MYKKRKLIPFAVSVALAGTMLVGSVPAFAGEYEYDPFSDPAMADVMDIINQYTTPEVQDIVNQYLPEEMQIVPQEEEKKEEKTEKEEKKESKEKSKSKKEKEEAGSSGENKNEEKENKKTATKYKITLNEQSGSGGTTSVSVAKGAAMPAITIPKRAGFTFGGYYTKKNGEGTQYYTAKGKSAKNSTFSKATTLYAKWTAIKYTVTFDSQNGNKAAYMGEKMADLVKLPSKSGHEFLGYFDKANGKGTKYYDKNGKCVAKWDKAKSFTLIADWADWAQIAEDHTMQAINSYRPSFAGGGNCAAWVSMVLINAGLKPNSASLDCNAGSKSLFGERVFSGSNSVLNQYRSRPGYWDQLSGGITLTDSKGKIIASEKAKLRPGMIIASKATKTQLGSINQANILTTSPSGTEFGHVGIVIKQNGVWKVMSNDANSVGTHSLEEWVSTYNDPDNKCNLRKTDSNSTVRCGFINWGQSNKPARIFN